MTDLTKPVSRRATLLTDHRAKARNLDRVSVTLYPNGTIGFRAYKCRREYRLPLAMVYALAMRHEREAERATRKSKRSRGGNRESA
jgi:hypothetical protein